MLWYWGFGCFLGNFGYLRAFGFTLRYWGLGTAGFFFGLGAFAFGFGCFDFGFGFAGFDLVRFVGLGNLIVGLVFGCAFCIEF